MSNDPGWLVLGVLVTVLAFGVAVVAAELHREVRVISIARRKKKRAGYVR